MTKKRMLYAWLSAGFGGNMDIHEIAAQFARLAPDDLDDFKRYVGFDTEEEDSEEEDSEWHSVWAIDEDGRGHRILWIHRDDIPALAERMRALPDGALNDERLYRGHDLFDGLRVVL